ERFTSDTGARPERAVQASRRSRSAAERLLLARPHVDDVAAVQLEPVRFVARQLRVETLAVVADELDARLEAEPHDALDLRLPRRPVRLVAELDIVRPHPGTVEPVDLTDEAHHELVRRLVVEPPRRRDLL